MMQHLHRLFRPPAALLILLVGGCATLQLQSRSADLALACYALEFGPWSPAEAQERVHAEAQRMDLLLLDTLRLGERMGRSASTRVDGRWVDRHYFGSWMELPGDSIRVSPCYRAAGLPPGIPCAPPMGGYVARLAVDGTTLRGRVERHTDVVRPYTPRADMTARQVACPPDTP